MWVAAEGRDVVLYPVQGGDLVEQAAVGRRPLDPGVPLDALPVVEGDHYHAASTGDLAGIVAAREAELVAATVDPHHHRAAGDRAGVGCPDVDCQPVIALRQVRRPCCTLATMGSCGGGEPKDNAFRTPSQARTGRGRKPCLAHRWLGKRDAAKDCQAVFPAAAHRTRGGTDLGAGRPGGRGRLRYVHRCSSQARTHRACRRDQGRACGHGPGQRSPAVMGCRAARAARPWKGSSTTRLIDTPWRIGSEAASMTVTDLSSLSNAGTAARRTRREAS